MKIVTLREEVIGGGGGGKVASKFPRQPLKEL